MYYWLIDSGGIMPIIQAESMADELVADSGAAVSPSVRITVRPNGPLRIEGLIALVDVNGVEWDLTGKPTISLCRCGRSSNRPFCDGTHRQQGWKCEAIPIPVESVAQG
jgi:CDGSH-type Zn-finger protein